MTYQLQTPSDFEATLASLFGQDPECAIAVCDDKAFGGDHWLELGTLGLTIADEEVALAVRRGAFTWTAPELEVTRDSLLGLLGVHTLQAGPKAKAEDKVKGLLNSIACIPARLGLTHPVFDPAALQMMPFGRAVTVIADTSGVLQGGLDFVARFLHPAARVKIPAIVHMEIVNFAERFFNNRRSSRSKRVDLLSDHIKSQGGQRALLRLELHTPTEVERTFLFGDPLRNAFQKDNDTELSELNLTGIIGAYADRLILEAARNHQAQAAPGHPVFLLTSDQGLARMALAEGVQPLFFRSVAAGDFFGRRLAGSMLHPFTGRVWGVPICAVLWELAAAFGAVRLQTKGGGGSVRICALGDDMPWSPYQSHADLLWTEANLQTVLGDGMLAPTTAEVEGTPKAVAAEVAPTAPAKDAERRKPRTPRRVATDSGVAAAKSQTQAVYTFSVAKLFGLIAQLDDRQSLDSEAVERALGTTTSKGPEEYKRFLVSGDVIAATKAEWTAKPPLAPIAIALRNEDPDALREALMVFPSIKLLEETLSALSIGTPMGDGPFKRAAATYRALAEVTLQAATVGSEGLYPTPHRPGVEAFAQLALQAFRDVAQGEEFAATGRWLETLIKSFGIHPEIARARLNDASSRGLLSRFTEGSTTETRFANHVIQVLRIVSGVPTAVTVHLYRGDYLITGKSSTSLRIEESKAP